MKAYVLNKGQNGTHTYENTNIATESSDNDGRFQNRANTRRISHDPRQMKFGFAVDSEKCLEINVLKDDALNKLLSSEPDEKLDDQEGDEYNHVQRSMFGLDQVNTYRSLDTARGPNESLLPDNELDLTQQ